MKKVLYFVSLLALVATVSCNEKESPITQDRPGTVTFEMNVKIPETIVSTRANADSNPLIDHIYVATFGRNQFLNEYVKAIPVGGYATTNSPDTYRMKVTLLATTSPRHVHVIANGPTSLDYQTLDTDLMYPMSTTYDDNDVPQGAYWEYFYLPNGTAVIDDDGKWDPSPAATSALQSIVLVRNFARFTVTNLDDNFELSGFHVFRTENEGSIAMPTSYAGGQNFVNTTSYANIPSGQNPITYITSLPYAGYTPDGVTLHDETATTDVTWTAPGSYQFVYESVKRVSTGKEPFIILEGHLKSEGNVNKYYKIELIDDEGNDFPILRNLDYSIKIEKVSPEIVGADEPGLAKTCNGSISTSVNAELSQLSDGLSTLAVLYTDKSYVNTGSASKPVTFMYMYDPYIEDGSSVTIEMVRSEGAGHAIDGATGNNWYTVSEGTGGWTNVTFNVLPSSTYSREAVSVFKVTGKSKATADGEPQSLFRYVTVHLLSMQDFISPTVTATGVAKDSDVTINLTLPDGLPVSLFPLIISVKDTKNALNPKGTDMPLVLDGNGAYHFEKTISWDEYQRSKAVTCSMRFIEAIQSSTITIDSEYFNAQTATVTGEGTFNFSK